MHNNIRKFRQEQKKKQSELAAEMGVKVTTISMWEKGNRRPSVDKSIKLSAIFGCSVEDLFKEETKQKNAP